MHVREVWSGGQTGVDRAALDAARELGLSTGGWVPRGRLAEDGTIPPTYHGLRETPSADYGERTSWNVRDSDATLILHRGALGGGSAFTRDEAVRLGKPCLTLDLDALPPGEAVEAARAWLADIAGSRLNVAGPRASGDPPLYGRARTLLVALLAPGTRITSRADSSESD
jgi:hypothetical protein